MHWVTQFHRGSQSSTEDMKWNFDTAQETKPIVRSGLKNIVGNVVNGCSEEPRVNHLTEPSPIATAPMEVERLPDVETELDDTPRVPEMLERVPSQVPSPVPSQPTRLSNGHTEEEGSSPPALQEPPTVDKVGINGVESQSESEDEDDDVITDTIKSREATAKEGGTRHMSALSITEETRALDEALSRSSVVSMEDSTTELPREEGTEREDPALYEPVGGSSSSEEDVQPTPEATQSLVSCVFVRLLLVVL